MCVHVTPQSVNELTLPPHLVDVTSVIRGALPVLPRSLAALCLTLNILLPGLGECLATLLSLPPLGVCHLPIPHSPTTSLLFCSVATLKHTSMSQEQFPDSHTPILSSPCFPMDLYLCSTVLMIFLYIPQMLLMMT